LKAQIPKLLNYLKDATPKVDIESSYDTKRKVPFGSLRLRVVELVYLMIKLNKPTVYEALQDNEIFAEINKLLPEHPWNNFL